MLFFFIGYPLRPTLSRQELPCARELVFLFLVSQDLAASRALLSLAQLSYACEATFASSQSSACAHDSNSKLAIRLLAPEVLRVGNILPVRTFLRDMAIMSEISLHSTSLLQTISVAADAK